MQIVTALSRKKISTVKQAQTNLKNASFQQFNQKFSTACGKLFKIACGKLKNLWKTFSTGKVFHRQEKFSTGFPQDFHRFFHRQFWRKFFYFIT